MNARVDLQKIMLVGIAVKTCNLGEMNPSVAKISKVMNKFFSDGFREEIKARKNPSKLYSVYTDYENDENGYYTYFFGEEVENFQNLPDGLFTLTIPKQKYLKLTSNKGKIPDIVIDIWNKIWKMKSEDFGAKRAYIADFEIYDERSHDMENAEIDVYIGLDVKFS